MASLAAVLALPASAAAESVRDVYGALAERDLKPAPLVFTTVPRVMRPIDVTLEPFGPPRGYGLRLVRSGAVIAFTGGEYRSWAAALKDARRLGLSRKPTRVRGHAGYVMRRTREYGLWWREGGVIYTLATGTVRQVPPSALRAVAAGLDRLGRRGSAGRQRARARPWS